MAAKFMSTLGFAIVLIVVIALTQAQPEETGETFITTTTSTTTPRSTIKSTCKGVGTCPPSKSAKICARNGSGMCRRFNNVCQLRQANCATPRPARVWQKTAPAQCKNIPAKALSARCASAACPRVPSKCPASTDAAILCVISKNRKLCRKVANKCVLMKLNCSSKPPGNWSVAKATLCRDMNVGETAKSCTTKKL